MIRAFDFLDGQHGWVVQGFDVLATDDGAQNWDSRSVVEGKVSSLSVVSESEGWLATDLGLLWSTDGGRSWDITGPEGFVADGVKFIDREHGWIWSSHFGSRLFRTRDSGSSWSLATDPCETGPARSVTFSFYSPTSGVAVCGGQPAGTHQLKRLARTNDGGVSWEIVAEDGILNKTANGAFVPAGGHIKSVAALDEKTIWMSTLKENPKVTTDGALNWTWLDVEKTLGIQSDGTGFSDVDLLSITEGYIVCGRQGTVLARTTDGGATWEDVTPATP